MEEIKELMKFLKLESRVDLKAASLMHILRLTGNEDGRTLIISIPELIEHLILSCQDILKPVAKDACLSLVNISAEESAVPVMLHAFENSKLADSTCREKKEDVVCILLDIITNPNSSLADPACMILSNMSRPSAYCEEVFERMKKGGTTLQKLTTIFCDIGYNKKGATLDYLAPIFSNFSQLPTVRRFLLDRDNNILQKLFPFTMYEKSSIRRGGIVGTLRNCCFEIGDHEWLLSDNVNILPPLLLPLAGPEEFDDEDNEKLPIELQYLSEDKSREPDPDIRIMLLEALTKLCAIRANREKIRDCNTYIILRELHKWEEDTKALVACENLVDLLIRTEEEIGEENLHEVKVPDELEVKFSQMLEDLLKDSA